MLDLAVIALVAAFFVVLLTYCLRMGVVGGGKGWQPDAARQAQPVRYWTGIAGLSVGSVFSVGAFIYAMWSLLT